MRPPRFDLRVAVGRNLTLTSLSLPLTRQDHDKTPVTVGGHLRALDMWKVGMPSTALPSGPHVRGESQGSRIRRPDPRPESRSMTFSSDFPAARVVRHSRRRARPSRALRDNATPEI